VARYKFGIGEFFESLTKGELDESLSAYRKQAEANQRAAARGSKYMRLNPPITGTASGGALQMGGDYPNTGPQGTLSQAPAPRAGYAWAMRRMSVAGLTTGTTPDLVNLHRRTPGGVYTGGTLSNGIWQFNGNNFAYTFSFGEMVFLEGETPVLTSTGAFASTATITLSADYLEVPQEMLYKVD
jgi:hypothetical protein